MGSQVQPGELEGVIRTAWDQLEVGERQQYEAKAGSEGVMFQVWWWGGQAWAHRQVFRGAGDVRVHGARSCCHASVCLPCSHLHQQGRRGGVRWP